MLVLNPAGELTERLAPPPGILAIHLGFGRGTDTDTLYIMQALPWAPYRSKTVRRGRYFE